MRLPLSLSCPLLLAVLACIACATLRADAPVVAQSAARPTGWIDVTAAPYFARGDGITDDTAALQRAISENAYPGGEGGGNRARVLHLPAGTYLVSRTLEWRDTAGLNAARLMIQGDGRERTRIQLADAAEGFADPDSPRPVLRTRSENNPAWYRHSPQGEGLGEGHLAFYNALFDLMIDTGSGNPSAIGADFHVNNMGGIERVTVRSGDGAGVCGLELTRRNVGPGIVRDVRVEGFSHGVRFSGLYCITGERWQLVGQRVAAIVNSGGVLALRAIVTSGSAPALLNEDPSGLVHMMDSVLQFTGADASGLAALRSSGGIVLRSVEAQGWGRLLDGPRGDSLGLRTDFWASSRPLDGATPEVPARFLAVEDAPAVPELAPADWADVRDFGAVPEDDGDDTAAIQRALDSGKPGVRLGAWSQPQGRYLVTGTLRVPDHVLRLDGAFTNIFVSAAGFPTATVDAPQAAIEVSGRGEPLCIERLFIRHHASRALTVESLRHASERTVLIRHLRFQTIANGPGAGRLFLENVSAHNPNAGALQLRHPQTVWARQLNLEDAGRTKIEAAAGVRLWVLGLKTERPSSVLEASGDAIVEIWGALNYQHHASPSPAYEISGDARVLLGFATATGGPALSVGYPELLRVYRAGRELESVPAGAATARGGDPRLALVPFCLRAP